MKLDIFEKIKVVKMYVRGITILPREDSVIEKGLKKLIKGPYSLKDMATAWELTIIQLGHFCFFQQTFLARELAKIRFTNIYRLPEDLSILAQIFGTPSIIFLFK